MATPSSFLQKFTLSAAANSHALNRHFMLFAYNEDGTLEVVADLAEARRHFDGGDVESGVVRFFDERGRSLTPAFPQHSERRLLGVRISSDRGPFDLETSKDKGESLPEALGPTVVLMPNRWFANLDAVYAHLGKSRND